MELKVNEIYKRSDVQDFFGGQRQGGISTPSKSNVVLLFSSDAGHSYGYQDGWTEDGSFLYTGEGQVGDMEFVRGNAAIRDHESAGKNLLLFIYDRKAYVRFVGEMRCVDYDYFLTPDRDHNQRNGIRFRLEHIGTTASRAKSASKGRTLHKRPNKTERKGLITSRVGQGYYRQQILEKFDRKCAVTRSDISEILIASHIVPWKESTEDERLDVENGILLSPNYDALFDKHLISFDDNGTIIISSLLSSDSLDILGINPNARIQVSDRMKSYLSRHRNTLR